jgi:hypothetical protein
MECVCADHLFIYLFIHLFIGLQIKKEPIYPKNWTQECTSVPGHDWDDEILYFQL